MVRIGVLSIPEVTKYSSEWVTYHVCRAIAATHDVDLVGLERGSDRLRESFNVYTPVKRQYSNGFVRRLLMIPLTFLTLVGYVRKHRPAVVASFGNLPVNGLVCAAFGAVASPTSVVRVTNDLFEFHRHQPTLGATVMEFVQNNVLGYLAVRLADNVVVLGPNMRLELERRGVEPERIHEIPQPLNFDEEDRETADGRQIRSRYDCEDGLLVLYVGYFDWFKGPDRLAETAKRVCDQRDDVHFAVVGASGSHEEFVRNELADYDRVHLEGWVYHDELPDFYDAADVVLHTSRSDGLPNVVLESLFFDVPVVGTDSGGEVTSIVSNVAADVPELAAYLLGEKSIRLDELPPLAVPERNARRYSELVDDAL